MTRVEIPAYTDRWMMGDRFGELVRAFNRKGQELARVRLDKSDKTVTVHLKDCRIL